MSISFIVFSDLRKISDFHAVPIMKNDRISKKFAKPLDKSFQTLYNTARKDSKGAAACMAAAPFLFLFRYWPAPENSFQGAGAQILQ